MQRVLTVNAGERLWELTSWLGASERSRGWRGFRNAAVALAITVLLRVLLEVVFAERAPTYMVFLAPVLAASLLGGVLPALVTAFLAWAISYYFFIDPRFSFKTTAEDWVVAGVFLVEGAAIALVGGRLRGAVAAVLEREKQLARANEALQMVADAGVELTSTLELNPALRALTELVVPRFADVCAVTLVDGSKLERVALTASHARLGEAIGALPTEIGDSEVLQTAAMVLRSDRPVFVREFSEEFLRSISPAGAEFARLETAGLRSLIMMPLTARGQTLGVMAFMRGPGSPLFDRSDLSLAGQIARRTAVATDNARLYMEARHANDAKDEFLGMMSHELRTPITVIHGGARVLQTRGAHLDEETRESLLGDIEREAERLSRMLENLLALARAELDREVVLEPVLLQRYLPPLVESIAGNMDREVSFSTDPDLPAVAAEPGYIEHIVRNLIGNAAKYSPPDSPIEVVAGHCGEGAAVRVRDRGFGIAPEEASRIFERFYRSDRTSRLASGAGLGLAVCKRLVEAMSGEIWAKPQEAGGLEVGFSVPPYREEDLEP